MLGDSDVIKRERRKRTVDRRNIAGEDSNVINGEGKKEGRVMGKEICNKLHLEV